MCKECKRQREAKRRLDPVKRAWIRDRDRLQKRKLRALQRGEDELVHKNDAKKTAPWNLLAPRPEARPTWEQFQKEMDNLRTPCFERPEDFSDFNDPRYADDPLEQLGKPFPSTGRAAELCGECPLAELCLEFAVKQKEDFGIYGGKRLVGGRIYTGGSGRNGA